MTRWNPRKNTEKITLNCYDLGWADTPAVRSAMPSFYNMMKNKLRTPEQGADTLVWLAVTGNAKAKESGSFYQDRVSVAKHLPLACSHSKAEEEAFLIQQLDDFCKKFKT